MSRITAEVERFMVSNCNRLAEVVPLWMGLDRARVYDEKAALIDLTILSPEVGGFIQRFRGGMESSLKERMFYKAIIFANQQLEDPQFESFAGLAGVAKSEIYNQRATAQMFLGMTRHYVDLGAGDLETQVLLLSATTDLLQTDLAGGFVTTRWRSIADNFANAGMGRVSDRILHTVFGTDVTISGDRPYVSMHERIAEMEAKIIRAII